MISMFQKKKTYDIYYFFSFLVTSMISILVIHKSFPYKDMLFLVLRGVY